MSLKNQISLFFAMSVFMGLMAIIMHPSNGGTRLMCLGIATLTAFVWIGLLLTWAEERFPAKPGRFPIRDTEASHD
jgi:hypothetical protein